MRFHEINFQTDAESFSFLTSESKKQKQIAVVYHYCDLSHFFDSDVILKNKKVLFLEKIFFLAVVNIKTKKLCLLTQFSRRFWIFPVKFISKSYLGNGASMYSK